jgi:MraZ protein
MATFIGDYTCKVDIKGRIMLPVGFKKQMPSASQDKFVVKKDIFEKCLVLFPLDEWERQISIIRGHTNMYNKEHSRFLREFFKNTAEISLDASNRMLLPANLLILAGIESDVVLAGQDGKIEIWAKDLYQSAGASEEEFVALAEKILGNISEQTDK